MKKLIFDILPPSPKKRPHRRAPLLDGFVAVLMSLGLTAAGMGTTISYFNDGEASKNNLVQTTILNLGLAPGSLEPNDIAEGMLPGDSVQEPIETVNLGLADFQYRSRLLSTNGDPALCDALYARVLQSGEEIYSGNLNQLLTPATTTLGILTFEFTLSNAYQSGESTCTPKIIFEAWPKDITDYSLSGYTDSETIDISLLSKSLPQAPLILGAEVETIENIEDNPPEETEENKEKEDTSEEKLEEPEHSEEKTDEPEEPEEKHESEEASTSSF